MDTNGKTYTWAWRNFNSPHQCPKCLGLGYVRKDGTLSNMKKRTVLKCQKCMLKWRYKPNSCKETVPEDFE